MRRIPRTGTAGSRRALGWRQLSMLMAGMSGIMGFVLNAYLSLCSLLNAAIIKYKIPVKLLTSPKKKREPVLTIGGTGDEQKAINIKVRIIQATNLPSMDGKGKDASCDCYVKVKLAAKQYRTKPKMGELNPTFNNEFKFESRLDATGELLFELWDSDTHADDFIGRCSMPIAKVISEGKMEKNVDVYDNNMMPVKNDLTRKPTKLRLQISWEREGAAGESEWLNMILRKSYVCFAEDVDALVRSKLDEAFSGLQLPMVSLSLKSFSIGDSAPFFSELRLLPTRSDQDLQLRAHLRWVASSDSGIFVCVQHKTKIGPSFVASVNNLEIDFPVWVQVQLQKDINSPATKFQLAATSEPRIRLCIALAGASTKMFPGVEEGIQLALRKVLNSKLVLPNKVSSILVPAEKYAPIVYTTLEKSAVAKLSVKVLEAENLATKQLVDKLNPYVKIKCSGGSQGDFERTTKVVNATEKSCCDWNEIFDFLITEEGKEVITFQLMDKGRVADDPCGTLTLPIASLANAADGGAGFSEEWYSLENVKTGRIKLAIEYARLVPDDGPTQTDQNVEKADPVQSKSEYEYGNLVIRVVGASKIPTSILGKPNPYVTLQYSSYVGDNRRRTRQIPGSYKPDFDEDFLFKERIAVDRSKQEDKEISVTMKSDNVGSNSTIGQATLKLKDVLNTPGTFTLKAGEAEIIIQAYFESNKLEPSAAVGSDWLNGILRKLWHVLSDEIEAKISEEVIPGVFDGLLHPQGPSGEILPSSLPFKTMSLERLEVGQEPPFFVDLRVLNTKSVQDVQLIMPLHWVSSDLSIKLVCKGNPGVPDVTVKLSKLDLYLPLWIQARLAGLGTGLGANVLEVAANEMPTVKIKIETVTGFLPVNFTDEFVNTIFAKILKNVFVLPKRIQVCLGKDPKSGLPWAANKKGADWERDEREHNGLGGCICNVGVTQGQVFAKGEREKLRAITIDPKCPVKTGQYLCVVDENGVPIYNSVTEFKEARFQLTDREKRAVGCLMVKLIEADNLHDLDAWGTVDAYCDITIPGTGQKKTSCTIRNNTAPVWNEHMEFLVTDEEHEVVKFEVFDRDLMKTDFLGEVELAIKELITKSGWNETWLPLKKTAGGGEIHVSLCYKLFCPSDGPAPPNTFIQLEEKCDDATSGDLEEEEESEYKGKLMVTISKGENLVKLDTIAFGFGSGLDPYVVVDFGRQRKKTKTKSGLNPIFNETFGFDCKDGSNAISIALTDAEKTGKDRVIGIRSINLEDLMCLPGKRWCDKFRLINPANGQECKDADGKTSLLYMTVQYIEEGGCIPPEPPSVSAASNDGAALTRSGREDQFTVVDDFVQDVLSGGISEATPSTTDLDLTPAAPAKPVAAAAPEMASILLRVIRANDLQKMDWTGAADPYVKITLGEEGKQKTRVIEKSLNPTWNEDFLYSVDPESTAEFRLVVKDEDKGRIDEYMGEVIIPVLDIFAAKKMTRKSFPLLDKKGQQVVGKSGLGATLTIDAEWFEA